jgi:DNA-binding NarL/FixJ family response regulator
VDLVLPDGDGTEVVREIKAAYPKTRVAVLSSVRDLSGALEAGADEALGKAAPLSVIIEALGRLASAGSVRLRRRAHGGRPREARGPPTAPGHS